jgi:hypothetical protein
MSLPDDSNPALTKNPLDPSTWNLNQNITTGRLLRDRQGNIIITPVFTVNPAVNPITAGSGTAVTLSGTSNAVNVSASDATALAGVAIGAGVKGLPVVPSLPARLVASGGAIGATSTTLLSAVSGKKYRIYAMTLAYGSSSANTGKVSINEATSNTVLMAIDGTTSTTGNRSLSIFAGELGFLQPTANNAIQVTSVGLVNADATIIYSAAE